MRLLGVAFGLAGVAFRLLGVAFGLAGVAFMKTRMVAVRGAVK